ncbi:histidinol dehydrogenase [Bowmanella dokdonensis]|uniref:Histidinol dehydrogenase n=1 Tax=Bowmanella dokdonensis TaxID=751969 RepID=A0A939DLT9_9ALTE|nr:histidinol dehydrogenase [Bowmanella dokdonensis]MBN7824934.1 histidinol dehydrogenase [Bowmanella dokdonensis]
MQFWNQLNKAQQQALLARPAMADKPGLAHAVSDILEQVQSQGDQCLLALTKKFDGVALTQLRLGKDKIEAGIARLNDKSRQAIDLAYTNIRRFHEAQRPLDVKIETSPGVICELKHQPIASVGLYIPGGTAPLPSTVLMLGATAQVAGCPRKVLVSPPNKSGSLNAEILYAAMLCGIEEIYLVGGAQAIGALALGTQSIVRVDKIFGPGNSFVTEAKQQVARMPGGPAIDMPAGPSEVLVIADAQANPAFVASDLLSQAEHGVDSQAVLVCDSADFAQAVIAEVKLQLTTLSRAEIARQSMQHSRYIVTAGIEQALEVSNAYGPEHLILQLDKARDYLPRLTNAGSVFVGPWSPESAGDYASGTNHVLPTYGYARNTSSLGLLDFLRRYTVQELTEQGLRNIGPAIMQLADAEGLDAHKQAVAIRLEALK